MGDWLEEDKKGCQRQQGRERGRGWVTREGAQGPFLGQGWQDSMPLRVAPSEEAYLGGLARPQRLFIRNDRAIEVLLEPVGVANGRVAVCKLHVRRVEFRLLDPQLRRVGLFDSSPGWRTGRKGVFSRSPRSQASRRSRQQRNGALTTPLMGPPPLLPHRLVRAARHPARR